MIRASLKPGSQASRILAWLVDGRSITPLQAFTAFRCLTLSQRIGELKRRGHSISSRMVAVGKKHVAEYRLTRSRHRG